MAVEQAMMPPLRGQPAIRRGTHWRLRRRCHHTDAGSAFGTCQVTVRQAGEMLASWAADRRAVDGRREGVVRAAAGAGLITSGIGRLAGIARSTLGRIPGSGGGGRP
jgi:hypothetical protein